MSSTKPFQLNHGPLEFTLLIPSNNYQSFQQLNQQFVKYLPTATDDFINDNEPSSPIELFAKFLGFINNNFKQQPQEFCDILQYCVSEFELLFQNNDIHNFVINLLNDNTYPTTLDKIKDILANYYHSAALLGKQCKPLKSQLFTEATSSIYAIFGGQGNTDDYFEELRDLYQVYKPLIKSFLVDINDNVNGLLKNLESGDKIYTQGIDLLTWLENKDKTPDKDYLLSVPVSCPLIGVLQLSHYLINCQVLGIDPGTFQSHLKGTTGHSQGLVTALVVASSTDFESFNTNSIKAVDFLMFLGFRCLATYPNTTLPPSMLQDSLENGEGRPSPMLSIRDLSLDRVSQFISETNKHLPTDKYISISLINGPNQFVVLGPPESLYGLNLSLRAEKASSGLDQSRVPFSQRKLKFSNRFLPIFAPFHLHLLKDAFEVILADLNANNIEFRTEDIRIPVFDTANGENLQTLNGSVVERLVKLIIEMPVDWERATDFKSTHILDFGPGGVSGLGILTHKNKDGTGTRIILAGTLDYSAQNDDEYGFKQELFNTNSKVKFQPNWLNEFKPTLVKTSTGEIFINTKFSRLISRPPLMVPGMVPTTVNPNFVISTLNSGYYIELGGGGYFNSKMMENAITKIKNEIKPGYGISINLIYVYPKGLEFAIPLIKELRAKGYPIQGLTIGAGVPSLEVANEYISELNLTHLGLKPGSIDAINQVITIAKHNPTFPIICQWTGGRGGGHHSFEDFHQPILQMYSRIRKCSNIVLIAGSGFGNDEVAYPYLNGSWSSKYNYPPMPFDGILFGSRVMTCQEAFTSLEAKRAIAATSGVQDHDWEQTFTKPTGGILSVISEMGEPIHKIATRGIKLWKEFDDTLFNLPKAKFVEALTTKKDYIIKRLNSDFQKVWFGKNDHGVCDLEDMTYQQVVDRMIELMYVKKSQRWIDFTLRNFLGDFLRRVEERFTETGQESMLQSYRQLSHEPHQFAARFFTKYSLGKLQLINEEDCDFFLNLCMRRGQKPCPFIPILDENFGYYFKKDSLWQSEDLEAVVDEDAQRTCILHGPVSAQFTKKVNEPIKEVMDNINQGLIRKLLADDYNNDESLIPRVEYISEPIANSNLNRIQIEVKGLKKIVKVADSVPELNDWLHAISGDNVNWLYAFLHSKRIVQGKNHVDNSVQRVLSPVRHLVVEIENHQSSRDQMVSVFENNDPKPVVTVQYNATTNLIEYKLIEYRTKDGNPVELVFLFKYQCDDGFAPILEIMDDRNIRIKRFYWHLWYGSDVKFDIDIDVEQPIDGDEIVVNSKDVSEFTHAIGNKQEAFVRREGKESYAPMDFAIVIGWKAIINAIFPKTVDGDLLKLVHLSNGYRMIPGAKLLKHGDVVSTRAEIKSVLNQANGKIVEVIGTIYRHNEPVLQVTSQFLYRGEYTDFENTFSKTVETPYQFKINSAKELAVLKSKEWFEALDNTNLLHKVLTFRCESVYKFKLTDVYSSINTFGEVFMESSTKEEVKVAEVHYEAGTSFGNPVIEFLSRNGSPIEQAVIFDESIPLSSNEELTTQVPTTNEPYARVSGDYNPIHVSRVFANYAKLPGTITHGMYSSGSIRSLVEEWAANSVVERVRAFKCDFVGMVVPNDMLQTTLHHIGMINGRKIIRIQTKNIATDVVVLQGEAEIEQPITTFVFTGQGSQEQGMGMDLYSKSAVAREVWDRADNHFIDNYGFSILDIVRNNPNELTIHFSGKKGRKVRETYRGMMFETIGANGELKSEKIFKEIDHTTTSYKFVSPTGLLSATQFTQPALTLMEKASYEDMKSKGLVPSDAMFAGHSLGEYSALSSSIPFLLVESLVDIVFYRGITMQVAVPRDEAGRSNYGMCAVNPSRVSATFTDPELRFVVDQVSKSTGWLLEIVNYNVENAQYVTAGDLRALDTLSNVLNVLKVNKIDIIKLKQQMTLEQVEQQLTEIITEVSAQSLAKPQPIQLERGFAVIPLPGISVPFHSSYLRSGVKPFQRFLNKKITVSSVKPKDLIGKYIPNLTAKPFDISKEYFEDVYQLTKSDKIKAILDNWQSYERA